MRKKLIAKLGILGLAAIFLLSMASYSTDREVTTHGKPDKPDKPDKPGKPGKPKTEWIEFSGDLGGGQPVDGCCPNAGPWPEYKMMLTFAVPGFDAGLNDGQLFINGYGVGRNRKYIVQFWKDEIHTGIEIIGGDIHYDKWNRILTVTFTDDMCYELFTETPIALVTFTLVRHPY